MKKSHNKKPRHKVSIVEVLAGEAEPQIDRRERAAMRRSLVRKGVSADMAEKVIAPEPQKNQPN